jgi:hypothetical protein
MSSATPLAACIADPYQSGEHSPREKQLLNNPIIASESDQATVWVHQNGETVARYGKMGFEVYSPEEPRRLMGHGRSIGAESWLSFKAKVREVFSHDIDDMLTPVRFWDELGLTPGFETGNPTFLIATGQIAHLNNPFEDDIWGRGQVTREEVARCIEAGLFATEFVPMGLRDRKPAGWDAQRIAFFVVHPSDWPIDIEVTSADGDFQIEDGFHRLGSKIFAREPLTKATLGGYVTGMAKAFPSRVPLSPEAVELVDAMDDPEMHLGPGI